MEHKKDAGIIKPLTDDEKWECVARWLNTLYCQEVRNHFKKSYKDLKTDSEKTYGVLESALKGYYPCSGCPIYHSKCKHNIMENNGDFVTLVPPTNYFKIIEQFTGEHTIVNSIVPL